MNPGGGFMNPAGAFYGDYAQQFPGMYSNYMGGLSNMVNSPFYQGFGGNVGDMGSAQGSLWGMGQEAMGGAQSRLMEQLAGGGLTPEYVSAMQSQVLEPAQQQLVGKLNSLGGGKANLGTSGLSQEHLANLSGDFADNLTRTGFENYNNAIQQLSGLGQFGASGSMTAFNSLMNALGQDRQMGLQGQQLLGNQMQWPMQMGQQWASPYFDLSRSILGGLQGTQNNMFDLDKLRLAHSLEDPGWAAWLGPILQIGAAAAGAASTIRVKKDVEPASDADMKRVRDLVVNTPMFTWKYQPFMKDGGKERFGIILEESDDSFSDNGVTVSPHTMMMLMGAIQQQQKEIDELKKKVGGE
jgi:hypothetical protein